MSSGVHGNGVHHAPSKNRHEQVGNGRDDHGERHPGHQPSFTAPMAEQEGKHVADHITFLSRNTHRSLTRTTVDREADAPQRGDGAGWLNQGSCPQGMKKALRLCLRAFVNRNRRTLEALHFLQAGKIRDGSGCRVVLPLH